MLCLLSPTKTLAEKECAAATAKLSAIKPRVPPGPGIAVARQLLVAKCKLLNKGEVKKLMGLSDALVQLNHGRFQRFEKQPLYPAVWFFEGPSFKMLNVRSLEQEELVRLESSLVVLSGLYGVLQPSEAMQAYRLEMGTRLGVDGGKNLYEFWGKHGLAKEIAALAALGSKKIVLNCASQEYAKAVDFSELREDGLRIVDIGFKKAGGGSIASVYAKQARGMMVRFVAKHNPQSVEDLYAFTGDGHFSFCPADATPTSLVFERHAKPQGPGDDANLASGHEVNKPMVKAEPVSENGATQVKTNVINSEVENKRKPLTKAKFEAEKPRTDKRPKRANKK